MRGGLRPVLLLPVCWALVERVFGEEICVEGYVMDLYCINRGVLLDNQEAKTLDHPDQHSFHCMLDVPVCFSRGFEVLLDPPEGQTTYCRGFRLDGSGNEKALALGRSTGDKTRCTTCTGEPGAAFRGFRATITGTVTRALDASQPGKLDVSSVQPSSVGCAVPYKSEFCVTDAGGDVPYIFAHGSLMIIGWGFLLPTGAIISRLFRHRPNSLWFRLHLALQTCGLLIALVGFIVALSRFEVFGAQGHGSFYHGCLGATTMALGLFQPLNAAIRPHAPEPGSKRTAARLVWEIFHKTSGVIAIGLAVGTIMIATYVVPNKDQSTWRLAYAAGVGSSVGLIVLALIVDKVTYKEPEMRRLGVSEPGPEGPPSSPRTVAASVPHEHQGS